MGRSYDIATEQCEGRGPHIGPLQCGLCARVCVCVFALSVCAHISFLLNKIKYESCLLKNHTLNNKTQRSSQKEVRKGCW